MSGASEVDVMELDPADHADAMHRIITSLVTPRPIGWISTRTADRDNLAPFSYFNVVSTYPPAVMFSASRRDGAPKDSTKMALETGEFVANLVTEDLVEQMDRTSAPLGAVSEFDFAGLEREAAVAVDAPRVAAAAACLECTVYDSLEVYDNVVTIGTVEHIAIDDRLATDGVIDMTNVDSVGRLGGPYYTRLDFLDVQRRNFGPWREPVPTGFAIDDDTGWLRVEPESFRAIRDAVRRLDDGDAVDDVAAEIAFDRDELATCYERRDLYLEGKAADERIEAALAEAGFDVEFTH